MRIANATYRPATKTGARYRIIYGGAGSGKSVFAAQDEFTRASDKGERVLVLRKVARTCRKSTFQLFREIASTLNLGGSVRINKTEMDIEFPGGGAIWHAGLDDREKLKSITGVTRIWIEEATELDEEDIAQVDLRLRGVPNPQITFTFNPTQEARKIFDYVGFPTADLPSRSHVEAGDVYVQHTTYRDNPFVGEEYVKVFSRLGGVMQAVYERGELVNIDAPDQVIPYEYVKRAFELEEAPYDGRQRLAIDVARFGDDETVFQYFVGLTLRETLAFHGQDISRTSDMARTLIRERAIPADLVTVDAVGMGSGVVDNLRASGLDVAEVISGAKPVRVFSWEAPEFNNLRSQMWFYARDMLASGKVAIAITDDGARRKLQEDLLAPRYRIGQDKRVEVEPKNGRSPNWGIKNRLGRSTDYGDAFVYGLFAEHLHNDTVKVWDI